SWPRLRDWITEDRDALRVHHQLTEAAAGWDGDRDLLYKGARLAQAEELDPDSLTEPELVFLTASQTDGRRRARLTKIVVSVLSVLVLLLGGTVVFAMDRAGEVARQRDLAVAGAAAAEARRLALLPSDSGQAIRLALAAYRVAADDSTRDHLLSIDTSFRRDRFPREISASPVKKTSGGRFFMNSGQGSATNLWDLRAREVVPRLRLNGRVLAVSDDDRRLVALTEEGAVLLDITDPALPRKLALISANPVNLSADSSLTRFVAIAANRPGLATVWTYDGSGGLSEAGVPGRQQVLSTGLSPDGRILAVSRFGPSTVEFWQFDGGTPSHASTIQVQGSHVYFSPDNRLFLLIDNMTGVARVWDVSNPAHPVDWAEFPVPPRTSLSAVFAADSTQVLIGTDRSAQVWSLKDRHEPVSLASFDNFPQDVTAFDYWPADREFVAVTDDAVWPMRTDIEQVVRDLCFGNPKLSDEDWARHFPGVKPVPMC
ncbi:WD40 repeat domain-containing protein, partial [Lentzea kentuckyensis]|uniref:WD40 repeat domain-containing protein n=1 Tax=Lentzea kentuckyensis TaxID=360086 RepID=UPI00146FB19B